MTRRLKNDAATGDPKPHITLTADDHARLSLLAQTAKKNAPDGAWVLADELDRARVVAKEHCPAHTVRMGSGVEFRDDATGRIQTVSLVYPGEADISQGKVSVLTPIGTALIGLRTGQSISWETRAGDVRRLTILAVREPEAA
jgi:regulator of nucleoside diphosphate kinase